MKKIDEAVKRFGSPDYGRTAKRLRDFEAGLFATVARDAVSSALDRPAGKQYIIESIADQKLATQRAEIEALQQLLNEKDYEIDMLRNIKPVSTRDLWFTAGLVSLIVLGAYLGFM